MQRCGHFQKAGAAPNVLATMVHHPAMAEAFNRFGNVLLREPVIGHRERELMLLRVAWRTRAQYEWVHHVRLVTHYGLDADDVQGVMDGAVTTGRRWSPTWYALPISCSMITGSTMRPGIASRSVWMSANWSNFRSSSVPTHVWRWHSTAGTFRWKTAGRERGAAPAGLIRRLR